MNGVGGIYKVGSSSNHGHEGSENGNENKKMNFVLSNFKPPHLSNVGDFSWSWIPENFIQVKKMKGEFILVCSRPP